MFNLFKQLKTTIKALKALIDYKFNFLDKKIFNILHDEESKMIMTEFSELTWDGNTEGLTTGHVNVSGYGDASFVKITDIVPSIDDLKNGGATKAFTTSEDGHTSEQVIEFTADNITEILPGLYTIEFAIFFVCEDNIIVDPFSFPEHGIYFYKLEGDFYISSLSINNYTFSFTEKKIITPLKQIDKKYIPGGVADWNVNDPAESKYIENRPFHDALIKKESITGNTISWDNSMEGLEEVDIDGYKYYRISSTVIPLESIENGGTVIFDNNNNYYVNFDSYEISEDVAYLLDAYFAIVPFNGAHDEWGTFPKAGLYVLKFEGANTVAITFNSYNGGFKDVTKIINPSKKIDNKYLPNSVVDVAQQYEWDNLVTWNNLPEIYTDVVRYDTTQNLNNTQKSKAILNLGLNDILRYSPQSLTNAQKTQVQTNLGISDTINNLHAVAKSGDYNDLENKPTYDLFTDSFGEDYLYGSNILFKENKINTEEIEAKIFEITDNTPIYEKISESTSEIVYEYFNSPNVSFLPNFYNRGVTSVRVIGIDSNPNNNFEFYATIDVKKVYVGNEEWTSCYIGDKNLNYRRTNYYGSTISIPKNPPIFIGSIFNSSSDRFLIAKSNTLKKVIIKPENPKEIRENFIPNTIARKSDLKNIDLTGYATEDFVSEQINQLSQEIGDVKGDLSEIYALDSRNLFNGATFTPNTFYSRTGILQADNNYSLFELDVEIGKTYIFGDLMRFVVVKENNKIVQGLQDIKYFTAEGTKAYITVYNNLRACWVMCENELKTDITNYGEKMIIGELKNCLNKVEKNTVIIDTAFEKNNNLFYGKEYKEGYFFNNILQENENYNLFLNVPVVAGVTYVIEPKARILCLLGLSDSTSVLENLTEGGYRTYTPTHNGFLNVSMYAEDSPVDYAFYEKGSTNVLPFNKLKVSDNVVLPNNITEMNDSLYGKKWAVCGDSFTYGSKSALLESGKYAGSRRVYPYFIGNRTGIEVLSDFFGGGKTLAYPSDGTFVNSLTCPTYRSYYKNIPVDVDYITIYLGINDSHHSSGTSGTDGEDVTGVIPLGTITDNDTSTYYGAWNVVLTWLMENRPFAHIGIIVSNGCDSESYRTAQIEIARKYGIPFIDMNGDDRTPVMIRSLNPNISAEVKAMVTKKQAVDYDGTKTGSQDWHPNDEAHEYESYFIENFLRSL